MMSDFLAASQHDAETNAQHKSFSTAQKSTYNSHSTQEGHVVPYQTKQHSEHQRTLTKRITFPRSANHKIIHLTTMLLFTFSTSLVNNHPVEKYPTECNIKQISGRRPILQIDDHAKKNQWVGDPHCKSTLDEWLQKINPEFLQRSATYTEILTPNSKIGAACIHYTHIPNP